MIRFPQFALSYLSLAEILIVSLNLTGPDRVTFRVAESATGFGTFEKFSTTSLYGFLMESPTV
jgi:hypothetical protein